MSVKVLGVVWDSNQLKRPTDTLVMLALADFASHDGTRIFPSVKTLVRMTRLSEREVQRTLRWLQGEGLIHVVAEARRRLPREYRIDLATLAGARGDDAPLHDDVSMGDPRSPEGRPTVTRGVPHGRFRGDPRSPNPSVEPSVDPSEEPSPHPPPAATGSDPAFELFLKLYPKKQGKEAAARAWRKLAPSAALTETILAALAVQKASEEWRREGGRFIPHPEKWLNGKRWEDQLPANVPDRHHVNDAWAGKTEVREVKL